MQVILMLKLSCAQNMSILTLKLRRNSSIRKIEKLKKKLYEAIESYGRDSPLVLKISQQLDVYIVNEMRNK